MMGSATSDVWGHGGDRMGRHWITPETFVAGDFRGRLERGEIRVSLFQPCRNNNAEWWFRAMFPDTRVIDDMIEIGNVLNVSPHLEEIYQDGKRYLWTIERIKDIAPDDIYWLYLESDEHVLNLYPIAIHAGEARLLMEATG